MITVLETQNTTGVSDVHEGAQRIRQQADRQRQQWQDQQCDEDDRMGAGLAEKGLVIAPETVERLADGDDWDTLLEVMWALRDRLSLIEDQARDRALFFGPPAGKRFVWSNAGGLQRRG